MTRRLHTLDLKKTYVLLCSPDELERIGSTGLPENTPIVAAIATEDGKIVDVEAVKKMLADL
jgi:hypothetical protein